MRQVADEIFKLAKGREIVLYGCSEMAEALLKMLESVECHISFIVDRNYKSFQNFVCCVLPPTSLLPQKHFPVIVPFGQNAIFSIKNDCLSLGYEQNDWFAWYQNVNYGIIYNNIQFGKYFQISKAFTRYDAGRYIKSVGSYTSINHTFNYGSDHRFGISTSAVLTGICKERINDIQNEHRLVIGNDVWIGAHTFINCSKVKSIGNGAIIGTGAIVLEDVPPYAVVVGAPAKIKKFRFNDEQIKILERIQWWNWNDEQLLDNIDCFNDYRLFFKRFS